MLQDLHDDYTVLAICVERSLVNAGLIATVAYQHSNYTWACKTVGGISGDIPDKELVAAVFKYGMGVSNELAAGIIVAESFLFRGNTFHTARHL